jgi:hypothetical protein
MKPEMRHKLAQLPFEEKIRKVGELIRLRHKISDQRIREDAGDFPQSAIEDPRSIQLPPKNSRK